MMVQQAIPPIPISQAATIGWVLIGIITSVALPLAVQAVQKVSPKLEGSKKREPTFQERIVAAWKQYGGNNYLLALIGAIVIAVALVFLLGLVFYTARDAALAGFAWESLLNKLLGQRQSRK